MMKKTLIALLTVMVVAISCTERTKDDVSILYPNWAEGIAITHLAKVALEEKGFSVDVKRIEPGPIYAALANGDADVYMDAWLPYTHKDYWTKYGDQIDSLGVIFSDGMTGLVVPDYVSINSIDELNANKDKFSGKIYGIAAGAGIHANTEKAIVEYKLDLEQMTSSETSMMTALKKAVSNQEWVVITGWKPHFMWSEYALKALDDPKGIFPVDEIRIVSRKGFADEQPVLADFFANFVLTEELLNELINDVAADRDPTIGARLFYEKHTTLFD